MKECSSRNWEDTKPSLFLLWTASLPPGCLFSHLLRMIPGGGVECVVKDNLHVRSSHGNGACSTSFGSSTEVRSPMLTREQDGPSTGKQSRVQSIRATKADTGFRNFVMLSITYVERCQVLTQAVRVGGIEATLVHDQSINVLSVMGHCFGCFFNCRARGGFE